MPSITVDSRSRNFDEQRENLLVRKITQLVMEHLDEPQDVRVRIYNRETPIRVLSVKPTPASKARAGGAGNSLSKLIPAPRCPFGRKDIV